MTEPVTLPEIEKRKRPRKPDGTYAPEPYDVVFWRHVNKTEGCWLWTATVSRKGYGKFKVNRRTQMASRVAWLLCVGPIPDGLWVLHRCDNPPCVNPAHLFLGTSEDNVADRDAKGRVRHGETHPCAKLKASEVASIRSLHSEGASLWFLAGKFGVTSAHISDIVNGRKWKQLA